MTLSCVQSNYSGCNGIRNNYLGPISKLMIEMNILRFGKIRHSGAPAGIQSKHLFTGCRVKPGMTKQSELLRIFNFETGPGKKA